MQVSCFRSSAKPATLVALLTVAAIVGFVCIQPAQGTMFLLGDACLYGLRIVDFLAGAQLNRFGIEEDIQTVENFCSFIAQNSIEAVAGRRIFDALRGLVDFIGQGNIQENLPQIARRISQLAAQITASGRR